MGSGPSIQNATLVDSKTGRALELVKSRHTFGRREGDFIFPTDKQISKTHWRTHFREGHFFIEDLNSSNRTFLNDRPIAPRTQIRLATGDCIRFGNQSYIFRRAKTLAKPLATASSISLSATPSIHQRRPHSEAAARFDSLAFKLILIAAWTLLFVFVGFTRLGIDIDVVKTHLGFWTQFLAINAVLPAVLISVAMFMPRKFVALHVIFATLFLTRSFEIRFVPPSTPSSNTSTAPLSDVRSDVQASALEPQAQHGLASSSSEAGTSSAESIPDATSVPIKN